MTGLALQEAVREWQAQQPDLIHCERRNGVWTLRACEAFQRARPNFKRDDIEAADEVAIYFTSCQGCEHFNPQRLNRKIQQGEAMRVQLFNHDPGIRDRMIQEHEDKRRARACNPNYRDVTDFSFPTKSSLMKRNHLNRLIRNNPNAGWRKKGGAV